jgi:pimeloyl-ACP methyl ester carboxylesterase
MRTVVLVHGAGSGPEVFAGWNESLAGLSVVAVDLQDGLDVPRASMADYARSLVVATAALERPLVLCGWSMGGLVALAAARDIDPTRLVLLEASPPAEIQGSDDTIVPRPGVFDPEEVYGVFPPGIVPRPESQLARDERKRGISVPFVRCPTLVVCGDEFPEERGTRVAGLYDADLRRFPGLDHWALVLRPEVRDSIAAWLRS